MHEFYPLQGKTLKFNINKKKNALNLLYLLHQLHH
jgi:hypothetical protein